MRLDDLRDLFAFLKTLPPVAGRVRDHDLPFPFNIRRALGLWKLLFLDGKPFVPDPSHSPQWNRGAYLVNGPGHCAECHSPRNALGAVIDEPAFHRRAEPGRPGRRSQHHPIQAQGWSETDIADTLTDGMTPDADLVGGNMIEVVRNTSQIDRGRSHGDCGLYQIVAGGRGAKPPPKKGEIARCGPGGAS